MQHPARAFGFAFEIPCKWQVQTEKKNVESFLMRNTKAGHMARVHLSDTCRKKMGGHYAHFTFPAFIKRCTTSPETALSTVITERFLSSLIHVCTNVSRIPTGRPFNNHCQSNQNIQTASVTQSMQKHEITTLTASTFN